MAVSNTFSRHPEVSNGFLKFEGSYSDYRVFIDDEYNFHVIDLRENGFGKHTYKEPIKKYGFDDIESVLITNKTPFTVPDILDVSNLSIEQDKIRFKIQSSDLLKNDYDPFNRDLIITKLFTNDEVDAIRTEGYIELEVDCSSKSLKYFRYNVANLRGFENTFPNPVFIRTKHEPNDPSYFKQTYLWDIGFNNIWKEYSGKGVKVAIYDQGFVPKHDDLEIEKDTYYSEYDHPYFKFGQHALMVGSIIGAKTNNGIGMTGIASNASITSHQLPFGESKKISMKFALKYDIVNNSWGSRELTLNQDEYPVHYDYLNSEIEDAVISGRNGLGTSIVFASGNSNLIGHDSNADYTHQSPFVINVGGYMDSPYQSLFLEKKLYSFPTQSANILVAAPTTNIVTLMGRDLNFDEDVGLSATSSNANSHGTSFAAPIVSGIIALMLEANPNLGFRDVKTILALSAHPTGNNISNGAKFFNGGGFVFNRKYGFGVVNADRAVKLAESWTTKNNFSKMKIISEHSSSFLQAINSEDIKVSGEPAKRFTLNKTINSDIEIESLTVELKATFPEILSHIDIDLISPYGTRVELLNRFGYSKILNKSFIESNQNHINWKFSTQNLLGEHYRGDNDWRIEVIVYGDSTPTLAEALKKITGEKADQTHMLLQFFNIKMFGKQLSHQTQELFYSPVVFTDAFSSKKITFNDKEISSRMYIAENSDFEIINLSMMESGISTQIDLTCKTDSFLKDQKLYLHPNHKIHIIKGGDSNDIMIGNDGDNIFFPARGNDVITTGKGSDKIIYTNVNLQNLGTDIIKDFDPEFDKILFGGIDNYDEVKSHITYEADKAVIEINSLKLVLEGVNSLTESNFGFLE